MKAAIVGAGIVTLDQKNAGLDELEARYVDIVVKQKAHRAQKKVRKFSIYDLRFLISDFRFPFTILCRPGACRASEGGRAQADGGVSRGGASVQGAGGRRWQDGVR